MSNHPLMNQNNLHWFDSQNDSYSVFYCKLTNVFYSVLTVTENFIILIKVERMKGLAPSQKPWQGLMLLITSHPHMSNGGIMFQFPHYRKELTLLSTFQLKCQTRGQRLLCDTAHKLFKSLFRYDSILRLGWRFVKTFSKLSENFL